MRPVTLHAPKGFEVACTSIEVGPDSAEQAKAWGTREMNKRLTELCGDGKPMFTHPHVAKAIYGEGLWEIKEWAI
jgi:hypothetical protein